MSAEAMETRFAPAERDGEAEVTERYQRVLAHSCSSLLDGLPLLILVLNDRRQLVFANKALRDYLGIDDVRDVLGKRPGELLGCIHSCESPGGCGTTDFCVHCGAVRSILAGILGKFDSRECQMLRKHNGVIEALDLEVTSRPLCLDGEEGLVLFSVADNSHVNRRRALERVFFHDIMNTAGALKGVIEAMSANVPAHLKDYVDLAHAAGRQLVSEIDAQRDLLAAERGELEPSLVRVSAEDILTESACAYGRFDLAPGRKVDVEQGDPAIVETDPVLLRRILCNMIKNGLEASKAGETVVAGWDADGGEVVFRVWNAAFIPKDVQSRIFNRSFSTKGVGRGLGTYGMKLLGERYLGGRVWFESSEKEGTRFFISLPRA